MSRSDISILTQVDKEIPLSIPRRQRRGRAAILSWLRKIHLYVGLWGALLGLIFGGTGFLLNHRAIMKIPVEMSIQKTVQVALPEPKPKTAEDFGAWLKKEFNFPADQDVRVKLQPEKMVVWGESEVIQPERWSVFLQTPHRGISAEYYVGNRFVKLDHTDSTVIGTLARLHMAVGVNAFWVLLSDSIAGSLILLSVTGLLLWTQLRTIHTISVVTSLCALLAATGYVWRI